MDGYLAEVERALLFRCPALLHQWLPGGRQQGQYYSCANLQGGKGESLKVYLSGPRAGKWADYAGDKGEYGGNLVSLYSAIKGIEWKDALHQLAEQVGVQLPKQGKRGIWKPILPIPADSFACSPEGLPLLPDIPSVKGHVAYWSYFDRDYALLCFRVRIPCSEVDSSGKPKKVVLPLTWCRNSVTAAEEWRLQELPDPLPLYNLPLLSSHPPKVLVVEGEKTAEAAQRLLPDWCVTTWPGGGKKVNKADFSPALVNGSRLVLWPDNDEPGFRAMTEVGDKIQCRHEVVRIDPSWPDTCDLADLEAMGWDTSRVESYLAANVITVDPAPTMARPEVDLTGKDHFRQMESIYQSMREIKADIYYYSSGVVYLRRNLHGLLEVSTMGGKEFRSWAAKRLATFHYNGNGKGPCPISEDLGNHVIFNSQGEIPPLKRFSDVPVFTPSGKLLDKPGYHPESQVYLSVPPDYDPDLPLEEAWGLIDDFLADFPFDTDSDKTAAVTFVLTAMLRDLIAGPTPLFRFEAPNPGTGKSLLCEALCEIITPFPQEYGLSDSTEETEKVITAALIKAPAVIRFDNAKKLDTIPGRALTSLTWGGRVLGESTEVKIPITCLWAATLNNPEMTAETFRRTVRVRLDARIANPDTRPESSFRHHPLMAYVRKNRGILVSAFCAVARAGIGKSASNIPPMGSYESWVSALAPVLEANGYEGFLANREEDRETVAGASSEGMETLVTRWMDTYGSTPVTTAELMELAQNISTLPGYRSKDGRIEARSFGYILRGQRDRVICGVTIRRAARSGSSYRWKLEGPLEEKPSPNYPLPYKDDPEIAQF